jgi:hypothetical protein
MSWQKTEKCICFQDGYMQSDNAGNRGRQFCIKGKLYRYAYSKDKEHPFDVATEGTKSHSMGSAFFHKFFVHQTEPQTILDDKLFEI